MSRKIWRRRSQFFLGFIGYWKMERFLLKIERKFAKLLLGEMPSTSRRSTNIETPCWKTPPNSLRRHLPELILQNTFVANGMSAIQSILERCRARSKGSSRVRSMPESTMLRCFRKIAIMLLSATEIEVEFCLVNFHCQD